MSKKRNKSSPAATLATPQGGPRAAGKLATQEPGTQNIPEQMVAKPQDDVRKVNQLAVEQPMVAQQPAGGKKSQAKPATERNTKQAAVLQPTSSQPTSSLQPGAAHPTANLQAAVPVTAQSATATSSADIRGVLIQLAGARLLLPNATIAEVLSYAPPEPVEAAPDWLLGKMRWRGWQLPLIAFAELAGIGKEPAGLGSKVVVLKALGGNGQAPYFAILSQGFPRLVTVSQEGLAPDPDDTELPQGVQSRVLLSQDAAFVPDLHAVEVLIGEALAQAQAA